MNTLRNLRKQHRDLSESVGELYRSMTGEGEQSEEDFLKDLSLIEGKLKIHLSMEDRYLYPLLEESDNEEIRKRAAQSQEEMGHIYEKFHAFLAAREGEGEGRGGEELKEEMKEIVDVLMKRIEFEETTLFPLLEQGI